MFDVKIGDQEFEAHCREDTIVYSLSELFEEERGAGQHPDDPGLGGDHEPPVEWDTVVSSLSNLFDTVPHHVAQVSAGQQTPDGTNETLYNENSLAFHNLSHLLN